MSYLVFKDGLPLFKDGLLQFSAASPPDPDCCCPTATPLVCCPEATGQSIWCDVSDPCLASAPVEFVYKGLVTRPDGPGAANRMAQEWEGKFCADGTGFAWLRCGAGYVTDPTVIWRLWLLRNMPGGTWFRIFGVNQGEGQCTPFAIEFTRTLPVINVSDTYCVGCPPGPCTFRFSL